MNPRFVIRIEADEDIEAAVHSLEIARTGAGQKFLKLIRELFTRIENNPQLYGFIHRDVRASTIRKYHYVVMYRALPDRTEIIAVVHGARDQSHWQSRL